MTAAPREELEVLAVFVHGALAFGHLLGLIYNVRRSSRFDAFAHGLALIYDARAAYRHAADLSERGR